MSNIPTLLTLIANEVQRIKAIVEPASNANALIEPLSFLTGTLNLLTDKISELQSAYDSNASELRALAVSFDGMEKERDKFAKEIEGLKSDVRSAEAAYEGVQESRRAAVCAVATLERLGYKFNGGNLWKPPLGKAPDFALLDELNHKIDRLTEDFERAAEERNGYKLQRDGVIALLHKISTLRGTLEQHGLLAEVLNELAAHPDNVVEASNCQQASQSESIAPWKVSHVGVDMAAPGSKDITVISWVCDCGKDRSVNAPRGVQWMHRSQCPHCASVMELRG